jgi:hypothetical protein
MAKDLSDAESYRRFLAHLEARATLDHLILYRNTAAGIGAVSLVIAVAVLSLTPRTDVILAIAYASAVAMPFSTVVASAYEARIAAGEEVRAFFDTGLAKFILYFSYIIAGVAFLGEVGLLLFMIEPFVAYLFAALCLVSWALISTYYNALARWWRTQKQ